MYIILCIYTGIPSVSRAIIYEAEELSADLKKQYYLLVEGYGLAEVMGASGVDGRETKSNHILEMQNVLGISVLSFSIYSISLLCVYIYRH